MILSKNAISRMCQKIQTELILFLCVPVMQKHLCTWGWRMPPQSCSSYYTPSCETDAFEKQLSFASVFPESTFKCDPGFAHPLKWNWRILLVNCLFLQGWKKSLVFVNGSGQVEVLLIACWRVEKAMPLISWVWRS